MPICSARCTSTARLDGKTVVITGCNTGIGKETVKDFYKRGARVIMACRSVDKAMEAKSDIERECKELAGTGALEVQQCDLTSLQSVRDFAQRVLDTEPQINILVNNAGVMACPKSETADGFEMQFGTNHLAHFLLTLLLLPRIRNSKPARIVTVSSSVQSFSGFDLDDVNFTKRRYNPSDAYVQSKVANILFSKELSSKLQEHNIDGINTYSLHPGAINTDLQRHMDDTVFSGSRTVLGLALKSFGKSVEMGAQTTIYCAVDEKCANETGLYYSDCAVATPSKKARSDENAKRLWNMSVDMVNLSDYNPFTAAETGVKEPMKNSRLEVQ